MNTKTPPVVACFGDSLIEGFPYGAENSWVAVAEKAAEQRFKMLNYGICGECVDDILYRLKYYKRPAYVTHIIFEGGMNDIIQGKPLTVTMRDFEQAVDYIKTISLPLALMLPYFTGESSLDGYIEEMRESMINSFQGQSVTFIDFNPCIEELGRAVGGKNKVFLDGVHPTAKTYEAMGRFAVPLIAKFTKNFRD